MSRGYCASQRACFSDNAADAVAESLVRAYRHLAQCRDPARLRSWLYRIAGNRCRSHLSRRRTSDISLSDAPPLADPSDSWAELKRGEQVALVERALQALPAEKREAFVLKHVEGMSYEEMATVTGARIPTDAHNKGLRGVRLLDVAVAADHELQRGGGRTAADALARVRAMLPNVPGLATVTRRGTKES